jgi:phage major head subunit gpT-like protein
MALKANTSKGIIGRYFNKLNAIQAASWAFLVAHFNGNSNASSETYTQTSPTPQFNPWVGMRNVKEIDPFDLIVLNEKYEATLRDYADNFKYDKTGQMDARINGFATRSVTHWAKLLTALLKLGTSTTGADGANFFGNGHHASQNNALTTSDDSRLTVVSATNPTAVEFANVVGAVIAIMQGWVDTENEPLNEDASEFLVVVPPGMGFAAQQAVMKSVISDSNGAKDNPLIDGDMTIQVAVNARLNAAGDDDDFYVFRTDGDTKAAILQELGGLSLSAKAEGSDFEHDTDMWEFGAKVNRGVGLFNWENAAKVTLTTA